MRGTALASWIVIVAAGCNAATAFPPGLEPLEDSTAPEPDPAAELQTVVSGATMDYNFAHARAVVHAPAGVVWAAVKDPNVVKTTRRTDRQSAIFGTEPQYEHSFRLTYEVDGAISVSWDEDWRYGTIVGEAAAPELAIARYQKVYGTVFITLIEGMIVITPIDDVTTAVEMVEHVNSVGSGPADIVNTLNDRFDAIVAVSHGLPIPPLRKR
jgi:hypothetical protein